MPSKNLIRPVVIEGFPDLAQAASTLIPALLAVLAWFRSPFRGRAALQAEPFALRHQLLVLQRQRAGRRLPLRTSDRLLWAYLSRIWPGWRRALILAPERRADNDREFGEVTAFPEVGGLHYRYARRAA